MLTRPHRTRSPVAREHLVTDEKQVVPVAQLAGGAQERGSVDLHARRPLHDGLEHDRGERVCVVLDGRGEGVEGRLGAGGLAGRGHVNAVEQHAGKGLPKQLQPAQRRHAQRLAVEGVFEGHEAAPLRAAVLGPVLQRELHGDLDGRGSVVAEEGVLEARRRHSTQRLGELGGAGVGDSRQRRVAERFRLPAQRGHQARVVVPQRRRPPGGVAVDVAAAVGVFDARSLRPNHHQRIDSLAVVLHRSVGMPHPLLVEGDNARAFPGRRLQSTSSASMRSASGWRAPIIIDVTGDSLQAASRSAIRSAGPTSAI